MRVLHLLPLVALGTGLVIPDEQTLNSLSVENEQASGKSLFDKLPSLEEAWEELSESLNDVFGCAKHKFEEAVDTTVDTAVRFGENFEDAFAGESWLETVDEELDLFEEPHGPPPRDGPPHHGPPKDGPPHRGPPHHPPGKKPGKKPPPHKGPHRRPHHKSNLTVYELIAKSKYTTKLAGLINEFDDLVELLNGTTANFTVFAPTDKAFEKIPKHHPKPSKEFLKKLLTYHVSPDFYPAGRVLVSRTIPTALEASLLGGAPQRLSTQVGFKGLTVNFYAKIVAIDIFGTNGVIHGIDSILLPPPKAVKIISFLPGQFSTLELGLRKTGLYDALNDTATHVGGTVFAPSNFAFRKLGPKINAFLFSSFGEKYLKALLKYHLVENYTLYSDAFYKGEAVEEVEQGGHGPHGPRGPHGPHGHPRVPKGFFHVDLPTLLEGKSLSIDVARYGRLITIKINGFNKVIISDGIAADGVIHVVPNVLIPPKTPGLPGAAAEEDMSVEELMERLEPHIVEEDYQIEL